jgi:hypothetical protein
MLIVSMRVTVLRMRNNHDVATYLRHDSDPPLNIVYQWSRR